MKKRTYKIRASVVTALVTAFTIAVALIWKDAISEAIALFVPQGEEIIYKFILAGVATAIGIIAIYLVLFAEEETRVLERKVREVRRIRR